MTLEDQLAKLAELGLRPDEGITIDDLLHSFDREAYEERPFDLILFVLGINLECRPFDRPICSRVWNLDTECINGPGDYARIVRRLCLVAGRPDALQEVEDSVDLDAGKAWLKYRVDGKQRNWTVEVNDDWADMMTLSYVMDDLERDGHRFYSKDNGQAMVLFYLKPEVAARLNELSDGTLDPVIPE